MRRTRRAGGQALVELTLVFPFFLLVVLGGVIDFGFAFNNFLTLQQMVAEAARFSAEGNGDRGVADAQVRELVFRQKPDWWKGNFLIPPIEEKPTSDGRAVIKKMYLVYDSPMFTPFYQLMLEAVAGKASIRLATVAAWQVPVHVH